MFAETFASAGIGFPTRISQMKELASSQGSACAGPCSGTEQDYEM